VGTIAQNFAPKMNNNTNSTNQSIFTTSNGDYEPKYLWFTFTYMHVHAPIIEGIKNGEKGW